MRANEELRNIVIEKLNFARTCNVPRNFNITSVISGKKPSKKLISIAEDYPLYRLVAYLQQLQEIINSDEIMQLASSYSISGEEIITLEDITSIYSMVKKFLVRGRKWSPDDIEKLYYLIEILDQIAATIADKNSFFMFEIQLVEQLLYVFKRLQSTAKVKQQARKFKNAVGNFIFIQLSNLCIYQYGAKNWQLAEMYARQSLDFLETIPNFYRGVQLHRKWSCKLILSIAYFNFGYFEQGLLLEKENMNLCHHLNSPNFYIPILLKFYKDMVIKLQKNDPLIVFGLIKNFFEIYEFHRNHSHVDLDDLVLLKDRLAFLKTALDQASKDYKSQLIAELKNDLFRNTLKMLQFNFKCRKLLLQFKENFDLIIIKQGFKSEGIDYQLVEKKGVTWIQVNIETCRIERLEKICRSILYRTKLAERQLLATPAVECSPVNLSPCPPSCSTLTQSMAEEQAAYIPIFIKPVSTTPLISSSEKQGVKTETFNSISYSKNSTSYVWPNTNLCYCSTDNNLGVVAALSSPSINESVWFGYIPAWIIDSPDFDLEFSHRLSRGLIDNQHIRDITKELVTWNNQNFSKEHPYKFKIVVPKKDQRLYGWIEDIFVDNAGKTRYLVCFGFLSNHKTKYLPNPETLKAKGEQTFRLGM